MPARLTYVLVIALIIFMAKQSTSKEKILLPFEVNFGQKFNPSEHENIRRIGNVRFVNLRTLNRPSDTEVLRAKICDEYGLQVVTWRSHIRSQDSAETSQEEIVKKFTNTYGEPTKKNNSWIWRMNNFNIVVKIKSDIRVHQNQIRILGPQNKACIEKILNHREIDPRSK